MSIITYPSGHFVFYEMFCSSNFYNSCFSKVEQFNISMKFFVAHTSRTLFLKGGTVQYLNASGFQPGYIEVLLCTLVSTTDFETLNAIEPHQRFLTKISGFLWNNGACDWKLTSWNVPSCTDFLRVHYFPSKTSKIPGFCSR